jgi:hypothetical protein
MTRAGERDGWLKPSVPLVELGGPAVAAMASLLFLTPTWADIYFQTSDFEYLDDGTIKIYTTGFYRMEVEIGFSIPGNHSDGLLQLQSIKNGVSIDNSLSYYTYPARTATAYHQITTSKTVYMNANDIIACQFEVTDATSVLSYGRLRITYIPSGGWNNNSGGKVVNRGIRR